MQHRSMARQSSYWLARTSALWLGLLLLLLVATRTPESQRYDIGDSSDERITAGFWTGEQGSDRSFRWTDGRSALWLHGYQPAGAMLVALELTGIQEPGASPLPLTIALDGQPLTTMPALPAWRTYHVLAVPNASRWQTPQIELISRTQRIGPQDSRELGVALAQVLVEPLGARQALPLLERAAFFATLLTLLFLVLRRSLRRSLVWGVTLVAAALLVIVSLLLPVDLAYAVPPLWNPLLILGSGLGAVWLSKAQAARVGGVLRWAALGLVLGLAGQFLLRMQLASFWPNLLGGCLLLGGALLAAAALQGAGGNPDLPAQEQPTPKTPAWLLLGGCLLLALALRLYQLGDVPFGMWRDEARHALLALRILNDSSFRPVYVPDAPIRVDLPALLFYLQAIPISLLGPTVVAARLVPALAGSLTVIPIYVLSRRLWGPTVGLAAALLLAVSSWHIALSRFASPAVLDPFFTLTGLVLLDRALAMGEKTGRNRLLLALAAGAIMALALYTYHTGRLMPLVATALIVYRLGWSWQLWRRQLPTLAAFTLGAVLVAAPLIHYILTSPESFNRRINQIGSVAETESQSTPAHALEENLTSYVLMWNVQGEINARHHVPLVPLVDPFTGLLFVTGLILLLRDWRLFPARLLLSLLLLGLVPGLLSSDAPHALRSIDVVAPTMLIAAVALAALLALAYRRRPATRPAVAVGTIAASALFNIWLYFGHTPYDPRIWSKFEYTRETAIGSYLRQSSGSSPAMLPQEIAASDVIQYLTYDKPVQIFTASSPPALPDDVRLIIPSDASAETWRWAEQAVDSRIRPQPMRPYPGTDEPTFWLFAAP